MKKPFLPLLVCVAMSAMMSAQQLTFRKGTITDSVAVSDSIPESFSVYLPSNFNGQEQWPVIFVYDLKGRARQALGIFREAAEQEGFLLAASNSVSDTLSITDNILVTQRMINRVNALFPIQHSRMYSAGKGRAAQIATLVPFFIREVSGAISLGSGIPNTEVLDSRYPYYFLGIVGIGDFNYSDMLDGQEVMDRKQFPNTLVVTDGGPEWPGPEMLRTAIELMNVRAMKGGKMDKDPQLAGVYFDRMLAEAARLKGSGQLYLAYNHMEAIRAAFEGLVDVDSLEDQIDQLRKDKQYRLQRRNENGQLYQETIKRDELAYYLEEDVATYNFQNLGWWVNQMEELEKRTADTDPAARNMAFRLKGFLNAMIEDDIDEISLQKQRDEEALMFLWMLKTVTEPGAFEYYIKIISLSAKYEDYGTSLFYLEELLKNGFTDKAKLYSIENTALLRITPEFNAIVGKYLEGARYDPIEE